MQICQEIGFDDVKIEDSINTEDQIIEETKN